MATEEEKPELQEEAPEKLITEKWEPNIEVTQAAEQVVGSVFPLNMRPSDATVEEFYRIACNLYKSGKYKEAQPFFHMLSTANVRDPRYLMGIAACLHMQKLYTDAAQAYTLTSVVSPDDPYPQYHLADCMIRIHEPVAAYVALEMALSRCNKNPSKYKNLTDRVNVMLNRLKNEFEEKKAQGVTNFREEAGPPEIPPGYLERIGEGEETKTEQSK